MTALALLCLILPRTLAAEGSAPAVISGFRQEGFPAPAVPACARVEDAYFQSAVLVGDSIAEGFGIHEVIPELEVLSMIGLSPHKAGTRVFTHKGRYMTLAEKLAAMQPSMVYLWLGSNGVDTAEPARVIDEYNALLDDLLAALPDTLLYLMELSPVTPAAQKSYPHYTNDRVDAFNAALLETALRHNVYLLPINVLLKNENGLLADPHGAGDGIHLRKSAYVQMADYLYTHAIPIRPEQTEEEKTP